MSISFNKPTATGRELEHLAQVIQSANLAGNNSYSKRCEAWIQEKTGSAHVLLTTSGTHALDMCALLLNIQPGDEVIMPSYTFSSTANAFALRGAQIVFVDIRPDTMNLDEQLIEAAITERTRAIVPVHYAGVACEMDTIGAVAAAYDLAVVEDAAQAMMASYKGRGLGSLGTLGCYSFHETKNYTSGEGGALLVNDPRYQERSEIIWEKGTNRSAFYRGLVDKYTWVDIGSSYLPSELNAAYLWPQLEDAELINTARTALWNQYLCELQPLADAEKLELPVIPKECEHNAHLFYVKTKDVEERTALIDFLRGGGIGSVFHYIPLHSSPAGRRFGRFTGEDVYTTRESERLLRLPMYYGLQPEEVSCVTSRIAEFYC